MSTHNLCFDQKYEKYQCFLSENFQFLDVKISIYLNMRHLSLIILSDLFYLSNLKLPLTLSMQSKNFSR